MMIHGRLRIEPIPNNFLGQFSHLFPIEIDVRFFFVQYMNRFNFNNWADLLRNQPK